MASTYATDDCYGIATNQYGIAVNKPGQGESIVSFAVWGHLVIFWVRLPQLKMKMKKRSWISSQLQYIIIPKSNRLTGRSNFTSLTDFYYTCANSSVQNYRSKSFFKLPPLPYQLWTCPPRCFPAILPSTTPLEYQLLLGRSHNNCLIRLLSFFFRCHWASDLISRDRAIFNTSI